MGMPTKLTPLRMERLLEAVATGQYMTVAAALAGIQPQRVWDWTKRAENELERVQQSGVSEPEVIVAEWHDQFAKDGYKAASPMWVWEPPDEFEPNEWKFVLFWHLLRQAQARAEASALGTIRKAAANGSWQADAWFLERTRPDRYGRRERIEHVGGEEGSAPIKMTVADHSVEGLMGRVMALAALEGSKDDDTRD